jgi:hypothetical protein
MRKRPPGWVVLLVVLVVLGALASYRQGRSFEPADEDETPHEVTAAVATLVAVGDCPWGEASCILAQGIERALQRGKVDAVMRLGAPALYICEGGNVGPMPICQGRERDTGLRGYPVRRRFSAPGVISDLEARRRIEAFLAAVRPDARDEVGGGGLELYAFACDRLAFRAQPVSCAHVGIILSAILGDGAERRREVLIFWAVGGFAGRSLPFTEVWDGPVAPGELSVLFRDGGRLDDLGEVHVIQTASGSD